MTEPAIIDGSVLRMFAADPMRREAFGPETPSPLLTIAASVIDPTTAAWLRTLPCPVVGIGAADQAQAACCDILLTDEDELVALSRAIRAAPFAAMVLVQHLRASEALDPMQGLVAESLAFATLQRGPEFAAWWSAARRLPPLASEGEPVRIDVSNTATRITLAMPEQRNAIDTRMRDALCDAFDLALMLEIPVEIAAEGRCFSTGGAVEEFAQASDPTTAHWVRSIRSPAARLLPLAARTTAFVQGATIGAGVEIAAFANRVVARPDSWFQLPELAYGLIPGAGGTVSIPRRIGRHRTALLALSMRRVPALQALDWGLIDAIES